tara:strand:- start:908 stop:1108 length:201 start_codon:yes stop_codon:yes gene_type:complete
MAKEKVKIRIQGTKKEVEKLRRHLLQSHPQLIMSKPRKGTNPKYKDNQKYSSYGDYQFNTIRKRRS